MEGFRDLGFVSRIWISIKIQCLAFYWGSALLGIGVIGA